MRWRRRLWTCLGTGVLFGGTQPEALPQGVKPPRGAGDAVGERVAALLAGAIDEDATRRRAAVERLAEIGPAAIPHLEEVLRRGNRHAVRTAVVSLGEIGTEAAATPLVRYFQQLRRPGNDVELAVPAAYALGGIAGPTTEALVKIVESHEESDFVRVAAALGLARRSGRHPDRLGVLWTQVAKRGDGDPEVLGALAIAVARNPPAKFEPRPRDVLRDLSDPAARAGIYLALAYERAWCGPAAAGGDLESKDPVLTRCALLGSGAVPRSADTSSAELRESRVAALGLGAGDRASLATAHEEADAGLRALWHGAMAARGWPEPLVKPVWTERVSGENGRFLAAALFALAGKPLAPDRTEWIRQGRAAWQKKPDAGAALLLGALEDRDSEAAFAPDASIPAELTATARIVWLFLRQDLDRRRFEEAVRGAAAEARVLPDVWLSDATARYAEALLGSGSEFFQFQSRLPFPAKVLLPPNINRRKRALSPDNILYADLWSQIRGVPFDANLRFPRLEGD